MREKLEIKQYSHNWPSENLIDQNIQEVVDVIKGINLTIEKGCSSKLRDQILDKLLLLGWTRKISISYRSKISITAIKNQLGLCIQTGNISRFYADFLKLQYLYSNRKITKGIYIVPTLKNAKIMGVNMANFERIKSETNLFSEIITLPILIIGIN